MFVKKSVLAVAASVFSLLLAVAQASVIADPAQAGTAADAPEEVTPHAAGMALSLIHI